MSEPSIFDQIIDRRSSDSIKWRNYPADTLPMWVADMDFISPQPVLDALRQRVEHGVFGYGIEPDEMRSVISARLLRLYGWRVPEEAFVFVPGVVTGFNIAIRALAQAGDAMVVQPPVYSPILNAHTNAGLRRYENPVVPDATGHYSLDLNGLAEIAAQKPRLLLLCNPHNPVGRVYTRAELQNIADICLRNGIFIVSDEIHCDLVYSGHPHLPIASLSPEVGQHSITFMAPSKTYNIAGMHCSVAIIEDADLRRRFCAARAGLVGELDIMGFTAMLSAYRDGQPWLDQLLPYLEANRDFLCAYIHEHLPGIKVSAPEGTYLSWLDCRQAGITGSPYEYFLKKAKVACSDGMIYGPGGENHLRLNFGCPRACLVEALERIRQTLTN